MKNIVIILTLFILGFGFSPCADMTVDDLLISTDQHDHSVDHSQSNDDECTPFCICQCCGLFIIIHDVSHIEEEKNIFDYCYTFHYNNQYKWEYLTTIWQPPAHI